MGSSDTTASSDGDQLTDLEEYRLVTYGIEVDPSKAFTTPGVRDGDGDADGDGVSDLDELRAGTNPADPYSFPPNHPNLDSDGDGLPDSYETAQFGGIAVYSGDDDADGDELTNRQERTLGTNPNAVMTNGTRKDGHGDIDGDNVVDLCELQDGTDPADSSSRDLTANYVGFFGTMEHKATWGAAALNQFDGTIMRATAIGFEDAELVGTNRSRGIVNEIFGFSGDNVVGYKAERLVLFRKGVDYRVELLNTQVPVSPVVPFVSGKYRFANPDCRARSRHIELFLLGRAKAHQQSDSLLD
jgi:hypothetical protein